MISIMIKINEDTKARNIILQHGGIAVENITDSVKNLTTTMVFGKRMTSDFEIIDIDPMNDSIEIIKLLKVPTVVIYE